MSYASHWRLVRSTFILIFLIQKERKKFRWLSWRVHTKLLQSQKANSIGFVEKWELPKEHAILVFILFAKGSLTSPLYFLITASVCRGQTYEDIAHKLSWVETMRNWVIETRASCKKKIHLKNNPRQSLRESFGSLKHGGFV